jgi:hypothetical protein
MKSNNHSLTNVSKNKNELAFLGSCSLKLEN